MFLLPWMYFSLCSCSCLALFRLLLLAFILFATGTRNTHSTRHRHRRRHTYTHSVSFSLSLTFLSALFPCCLLTPPRSFYHRIPFGLDSHSTCNGCRSGDNPLLCQRYCRGKGLSDALLFLFPSCPSLVHTFIHSYTHALGNLGQRP